MDREVLFLIIGLIGGAVVSLLVNYFTHFTANPLARQYREWRVQQRQERAKRSVESAKKRVESLEELLKDTERYANDLTAFTAYIVASFMGALSISMLGTVLIVTGMALFISIVPRPDIDIGIAVNDKGVPLLYILLVIFTIWGIFDQIFRRTVILAMGIVNFNDFKFETEKQIAELQEVIDRGQPQTEE